MCLDIYRSKIPDSKDAPLLSKKKVLNTVKHILERNAVVAVCWVLWKAQARK